MIHHSLSTIVAKSRNFPNFKLRLTEKSHEKTLNILYDLHWSHAEQTEYKTDR